MKPKTAEAITRSSKSNLAFAFLALPPERRADLNVFYAFCRVVDDIADEPGVAVETRQRQLDDWKRALREAFEGEPPLAAEMRALLKRHGIDRALPEALIDGCASDLHPVRHATFDDLLAYCYRVASAVGLVSITLFGCRHPGSRDYAVALGYALQLTNILRDVGKDWANGGRVYLPQEDMARFGVSEEDLRERKGGPGFQALMAFEADRAEALFAQAVAARPAEDRRALAAAEMMRLIYHRLLQKMKQDGFQVFDKEYRLGKLGKLAIALRVKWGLA